MLDDFKPRAKSKNLAPKLPRVPQSLAPKAIKITSDIPEPTFVPPEAIAAVEEQQSPLATADNATPEAEEINTEPESKLKFEPPVTTKKHKFWPPPWPPTKKQWIIIAAGGLLIIGLIGLLLWFFVFKKPTPVQSVTKPSAPKIVTKQPPKTVASRLTGVQVTPDLSNLPVTGVMIENSPDARPQSGLVDAGVVYEAIAEGGVTRFLALYEEAQPDYIGPVRSARPYYVDWLLPYNAGYAHVGGSPDGLAAIKTLGVRDLDQFYNSGAYQRISSRDAPHNVYTSAAALLALEKSKGYTSSNFTGFPRKSAEPSTTPTARSIDFTISGPLYSPHYDYDPTTNTYKRSEGGAPHTQLDSAGQQTQIAPKVVIAMVVPQSSGALDASGAYYTVYSDIGTGQVDVFQDGTVTQGNWTKTDSKSQLSFTDGSGQPIKLNPGQTWISVVGLAGDISYQP